MTFGPDSATLEVLTLREGVLAAARRTISSFAPRALRDLPSIPPGRPSRRGIEAGSLPRRDRAARRPSAPGRARSAADVRDIERTIASTVLGATSLPGDPLRVDSRVGGRDDGFEVRGTLALAGRKGEVIVPVRRAGDRLVAEVVLHQPAFGIRPYRAMLGALRVKPDVAVRASLPAAGI